MGDQKFWIPLQPWTHSRFCALTWWGIRNSECLLCKDMGRGISNSEGLKVKGGQKFRMLLWRKLRWVHDLFYIKLKWFRCSHEHYDGIEKLDVLILVDSTEHFIFPLSLPNLSEAQTFSPANANMVLNFLKSKPHILVWRRSISSLFTHRSNLFRDTH